MKTIYLDNGATSYPKPETVKIATLKYFDEMMGNAGRSTSSARSVDRLIYDLREHIAKMFHFNHSDHVIFTKNITESINTVLFGYLKEGDHVLISNFEHNAVVRPVVALADEGRIEYDFIPFSDTGKLDVDATKGLLRPNTRLIISLHASNITGQILEVTRLGQLARENNVKFMLDVAQTAGFMDINMAEMKVDCLAFTGHKSLLGPTGTGGFLIDPDMARETKAFIYGGTGSLSESFDQPKLMPDHFESGTLNLMGLLGLAASLEWIAERGYEAIQLHERSLIKHLEIGLSKFEAIICHNLVSFDNRTGVLALSFKDRDPSWIAHALNRDYGIITRVGLQCAPIAHKTLGTFPSGVLRISVSPFNTIEEIDHLILALKALVK